MESYNIQPFVSGFFHLASCSQGSPVWYFVSFHGWFLFCGCVTCYLFISGQMNIWVVSTFGVLWIMLLWTLLYRFFHGHMDSFILGIILEVELHDQETWKIVSKSPMESIYQFTFIKSIWGLPCWLKNKETCQCRRRGFDCWSKKIPHPTCHGTTKPECHNYWDLLCSRGATTIEPTAATTEAHLS